MNSSVSKTIFAALLLAAAFPARADWPQWRGPERNGTAPDSSALPDSLDEGASLEKLWEVEGIPSDRYGGHGSVAVSGGAVFLSIVWHRDEPTPTRRIDRDVLATLGFRGTRHLPNETVEKMEHDRMNLSRRLRGKALDEYAAQWVEENLDEKTRLSLGGWVASRFKKGKAAIPLAVYDQLLEVGKTTFDGQAEMEEWVRSRGFDPAIADQIIKAVPSTEKMADDVVLSLDAETGEERWKFSAPGAPSGRASSSTPAVFEGKVYAALSEHLYCLDAGSGREIWRTPLSGKKGPASSPLVHLGKVYLQQNRLTAFDAATGEELWSNQEVKGANQSPAVWKETILCNAARELIAVDARSGETLWKQPGGGDSTPVVSGDRVVVCSRSEGANLNAYALSGEGAYALWSREFVALRYGSSPVIHGDHVYHLGSSRHLCVHLESGETAWERQAQSAISSPILADGKLLVFENRGGLLSLIEADPGEYRSLGKTKVGALQCASPALVERDLYLRTQDSVVCYRLP